MTNSGGTDTREEANLVRSVKKGPSDGNCPRSRHTKTMPTERPATPKAVRHRCASDRQTESACASGSRSPSNRGGPHGPYADGRRLLLGQVCPPDRPGMSGEQRAVPRIFGRPFDLHAGIDWTPAQLVLRLNDWLHRATQGRTPCESSARSQEAFCSWRGRPTALLPSSASISRRSGSTISKIVDPKNKPVAHVCSKRRCWRRSRRTEAAQRAAREHSQTGHRCVIAIEDRRFYDHPGIDIIRSVGAILTNLKGDKRTRRRHADAADRQEYSRRRRRSGARHMERSWRWCSSRANEGPDSRLISTA